MLRLYVSFLVIHIFCINNCDVSTAVENHRNERFFFLPAIIPLDSFNKRKRKTHEKISCKGDCGLEGLCSEKSDCSSNGGKPSGICLGNMVCCINYKKCGTNTSNDMAYFINSNYPESNTEITNHCFLKVFKSNPRVCQLRITFKDFSIAQPSKSGNCIDDFFTISDCINNKLCGENKNQHIYANFKDDMEYLTLSVNTNPAVKFNRLWNIEIKQINCDSRIAAPSGCLMYFTSTSGTVTSFNYGEPKKNELKNNRQLREISYGICVERKDDYCFIEWGADSLDSYSFTVSGNSSLINEEGFPLEKLALKGSDCQNNYIIIPRPIREDQLLEEDRFCGSHFSTTMTSTKPYVLYVVMNQNNQLALIDEGNRGFKLNFRQIPCHR